MNETKTRTVDTIGEGDNTMILRCFADGMPRPTVTWYKVRIHLQFLLKMRTETIFYI